MKSKFSSHTTFKVIYIGLFILFNSSIIFAQKRPNILFIAVDDLRPELGCYGSPIAKTPNFDRLAKNGLLFERAYCQEAICSPSRASIMTGARPETIKVIENFSYFRDLNPDIVTLPQLLWKNGYETVYTGKIFHPEYSDEVLSWSREPVKLKFDKIPKTVGGYASPENQAIFIENKKKIESGTSEDGKFGLGRGPAFESYDVPDETYVDGQNTTIAIATLKELIANPGKPFFLGMGYKLPHLDWIAPQKYWDMYDRNSIPLAEHDKAPIGAAAMGLHPSFELRARYGIPKKGDFDEDFSRTLKHAYLASVSYVDAQLGRLLDALEQSGQSENTVIILWSDHGWHLGDMGIWGKATNYDIATRVPFIICTPNMSPKAKGGRTNALVELVDIYPTVCELTNTPKPEHLEGHSLVPLFSDPSQSWKKGAFSQFPCPALREWAANPLSEGMRKTYFGPLIEQVESKIIAQQGAKWDKNFFENDLMGYALKTDRYKLVAWKSMKNPKAKPIFLELYDHKKDPDETVNIASTCPKIVNNLLKQLNLGWKGNLPSK
jgi:iduronate 2-sulfatase